MYQNSQSPEITEEVSQIRKDVAKFNDFKSLKASYQNLSNEKIILPITGGYDSRLSLGFLKDNVDLLIHQLNNEEDTKIVYELNDIVKKELVILNKKIDKEVTTSVSQRLIASSVRPTFFKWFQKNNKAIFGRAY